MYLYHTLNQFDIKAWYLSLVLAKMRVMLKKIKTSKSKVFIVATILVLVAVVLIFVLQMDKKNNVSNGTTEGSLNLGPPTEQDKQAVEENKQRIVEQNEQIKNTQQNQTNQRQSVKPVVTMAQQSGQAIEVSAYIPGIFEDGGECKAIFTKSGISFSKTSIGVKEGRNVYCPLISANASEFSQKGEWAVKLLYESPFYVGSSEETRFNVN